MSNLIIDLKYIGFVSSRLKNFKRVKADLFAFSHNCEDNNSAKIKRRGYIYKKGTGMNVFCHHCGYSRKFSNFLREEDPTLYGEYRMEIFKENSGNNSPIITSTPKQEAPVVVENKKFDIDDEIILLSELNKNHPALSYVKKRQIPEEFFDRIGIVPDFNRFASTYEESFSKKGAGVPRLIFPFFNKDNSVVAYSGRAFGREKPKYIILTVEQEAEKIYGLWRIRENEPIIVVEGQIDSLFLDNCVAVSGANYTHDFLHKNKDRIIIVPDIDFKRNDQVFRSLNKAIDSGFKVSFLPSRERAKDVNDLIVKYNLTGTELTRMIRENAKSGLDAKVELIFKRKT